jgi:hypothetical protein
MAAVPIWQEEPVHSAPLLLLAELGAPTFFLLSILAGGWLARRWRWMPRLATALFLALAPGFLLDHFWVTHAQGFLFLGIAGGLLLSQGKERRA